MFDFLPKSTDVFSIGFKKLWLGPLCSQFSFPGLPEGVWCSMLLLLVWVVAVLMLRKQSLSSYFSSQTFPLDLQYKSAAERALVDGILPLQQKSCKGHGLLLTSLKCGQHGVKYPCRQDKLSYHIEVTASFWSLSRTANFNCQNQAVPRPVLLCRPTLMQQDTCQAKRTIDVYTETQIVT